MKRMILASCIGLIASGAYASDLSYGGPYSQMKLKLCSDTPPSRSILPDGSLVCDGEDNDPNAYCVGGFNYADTDIFNCGTERDFDSEDLNFNGIPDKDEDWDGDGIANGEDPNPTENGKINVDANGNGIPDSVEEFYDTIGRNTPDIVRCDSSDPDCSEFRYTLHDLVINNRELGETIRNMSADNVQNGTFTSQMKSLAKSVYQQHEFTRYDLELNRALIKGNNGGGVDNSSLIRSEFKDVDAKFAEVETNFDDVDENLFRSINVTRDAKDDILRALNNSSGVGLTSSQERQLRDAAKAKNNGTKLNDIKNYTSDTNRSISQVKDQVNTTLGAVASQAGRFSNLEGKISSLDGRFDTVDGQFSQLSDQIAAISGGQSTVDLSGVESSIDALSDKIDGIEGVGNGEGLAEISSKLDGLATGVTDIGELLKGVDASKAGIDGTCIQGGTCQGFYESAYEGDLSDVVTAQLDAMKTSIVDPFVSSFGNIDLSGAQRPKFGLPVPFYGYMSFDDYIDMDWIFGFLRFIFLASTAFYCRQIIFGG
ncbi:hypothetical protein AB6D66_26040 [Vibrio pomeroyi]|uniref:Uncharacterized protein n=1 Tax=Vibrio pomeroyi TaxID=198832 RepID=A0ABV4N4Z0_9VIBR